MKEEAKAAENRFAFQPQPHQDENGSRKQLRKKRRKEEEQQQQPPPPPKEKKKKKKKKKKPTVSIAVPGSIIDNAQSLELATLLAGQIARAATIFRIDEVVVFDNRATAADDSVVTALENADENEGGAQFLTRVLRYLETPQYLRRRLFPMHSSLRYVGLLPPLDAPHHVRKYEWSPFRDGVTLEGNPSNSKGTPVDVGLSKNIMVQEALEPGKRVTIAMGTDRSVEGDCLRKVVKPSSPRDEMELYWGYKVRYASNLSCVLRNCPYKGGYDHIVGTSEHGLVFKSSELVIPSFRHLLIAFGGLAGLEESIEEDNNLKGKGIHEIFHSYLNTCPHQGSRTIRTEEAIFISLQYFREPINRAEQQCKE